MVVKNSSYLGFQSIRPRPVEVGGGDGPKVTETVDENNKDSVIVQGERPDKKYLGPDRRLVNLLWRNKAGISKDPIVARLIQDGPRAATQYFKENPGLVNTPRGGEIMFALALSVEGFPKRG